jgi:ribosomal protein S30
LTNAGLVRSAVSKTAAKHFDNRLPKFPGIVIFRLLCVLIAIWIPVLLLQRVRNVVDYGVRGDVCDDDA